MNFAVILEKFLAWWYANMILGIVLIAIALLLMAVSIGRSVYGYFRNKSKLAKMNEHAKQLGAMPLNDGSVFVSIKHYRVSIEEMHVAGLGKALRSDLAGGDGVNFFVRMVGNTPEELGARNAENVVCQYETLCNEKEVWNWKVYGFIVLPEKLLHEAE
jgi:hypothetical protein